MSSVRHYSIPTDGNEHILSVSGPVVFVGMKHPGALDVWAESLPFDEQPRRVQAFATGATLPAGSIGHVGSALSPVGVAWHLYELVETP